MNRLYQTSKITILIAAFLSFLLSVYLWFSGAKDQGIFVAIWVPSILSLGTFIFTAWRKS
ncbi:MAG: hypothetical protein ISR58_15145 [Anaerolineales bacterium]|nr:hypothetical protein [Chloroflexota bacterium]MBL6982514.1 hypothetical protein [Anaerolineales bacterium]